MKFKDFEVGKIYEKEDGACRYKLENDGTLMRSNWKIKSWYKAENSYNSLIESEFKEVKRELDWSKVPKWTKVQVRQSEKNEWENERLVEYVENSECRFKTTICDEFTYVSYLDAFRKNCRIHPSIEIQEEWYKED